MADYLGPPPGATGASAVPVDPEAVRVGSKQYPKFHLASKISPPNWVSPYNPKVQFPMVDILPSDTWTVRHFIGGLFIITSETYDTREKVAAGKFGGDYINGIFITPEGHVSGGWICFKNPKKVILASDRKTYLVPSPSQDNGWEKIVFERVE